MDADNENDVFEDTTYLEDDNEATDPSFNPNGSQSTRSKQDAKNSNKTRQKSYKKKVERQWTDDDILKLIKEIEAHRVLWDFSDPRYKCSKEIVWQQVADAVSSNVNDCKGKWGNLRTSFNSNLVKYRKRKSGQGTDESFTVAWKFFQPMLFLEASKVGQATESTSNMHLVTCLVLHSYYVNLNCV